MYLFKHGHAYFKKNKKSKKRHHDYGDRHNKRNHTANNIIFVLNFFFHWSLALWKKQIVCV